MAKTILDMDVVIVGAGPAGIAAAVTASRFGLKTALVEDSPGPGGQVWQETPSGRPWSRRWLNRLRACGAQVLGGTTAVCPVDQRTLLVETLDDHHVLAWRHLILATGARELLLPMPGWTVPGVFGAAGLARLAKNGWPVAGKKVVVAGSGPLLLPAALTLKRYGARIALIAEQAPIGRLIGFALACMYLAPAKLLQAWLYGLRLANVRYKMGCWPASVEGDVCLKKVSLVHKGLKIAIDCDILACGFGLVPNLELARLLGCSIQQGVVCVDQWQRTSVPGIYAAGEQTCIAGMEHAILSGRIAALVIAGQYQEARPMLGACSRARRFGHALARAFALRPEVLGLADQETIICRCEDVTAGQLQPYTDWRKARLMKRCGMGPCQGRICGAALSHIKAWPYPTARPPLLPTRIATLIEGTMAVQKAANEAKGDQI
ncbi:MAG: FAD/NAD(P)-binding oxidoreductase [Sedimentisphaerales bacterium]|jgi:NADPH-dependent 2,4-dienoyl-CoA reductase/sulfur reductase-like enzyme|nr:FAD/NAD(P)-binding oxidoreductase [Sedimentisphaerales bacterium]